MTKEELMVLLRNPDQTGQAIDELNRLIDEYPFFHTGHQLYIKGLREIDEKKMVLQLKKTALFVRDREVLYHYINRLSYENHHNVQSAPSQPSLPEQKPLTIDEESQNADNQTITEDKMLSIDQLLNLIASQPKQLQYFKPEEGKQPSPEIITGTVDTPELVDNHRRRSDSELIDFFLELNPKITPNNNQYEVDLSESLQDNQEVATETLADIYATQGHKGKAIEIYKQLILKYPEKHIYFAAQIERLKE